MKKGFTLVELLAVIIILSIIALITTFSVNSIIKDSKKSLSETQINNIEKAAEAYYLKEGMDNDVSCVNVSELLNKGYLDKKEVKDPKDNEDIIGSVNIKYEENQYSYEYQTDFCEATTLYTGTIYRNLAEILYMGDDINNRWCIVASGEYNTCVYQGIGYFNIIFNSKAECEIYLEDEENPGYVNGAYCEQQTLSYETNLANINTNAYLKHEVTNNIVTASYACITYVENGTRKDICLRGYDKSYYASNQEILRSVESYINTLEYGSFKGYCEFFDSYSNCFSPLLELKAFFSGTVGVGVDSSHCIVYSDDISYCYE